MNAVGMSISAEARRTSVFPLATSKAAIVTSSVGLPPTR
jgi:hypothetical protein